MNTASQIKVIRKSKLIQSAWYAKQNSDVLLERFTPAEHYYHIGAKIGRNPGRDFDTQHYVNSYPEVEASGLNPVVHYIKVGKEKGYLPRPAPETITKLDVSTIRHKLLGIGFQQSALSDFEVLSKQNDIPVAIDAKLELALWQMRSGTSEGFRKASRHLDEVEKLRSVSHGSMCRIAIVRLLSYFFEGLSNDGKSAYATYALNGLASPDLLLVRANFEDNAQSRLPWLNAILDHYGISGVSLDSAGGTAYDRLCGKATKCPNLSSEMPKVSIILAAYEAPETILTALKSIQNQTYQNLEVIIVDDASPTNSTEDAVRNFIANDKRFSYYKLNQNGGAYIARNYALDRTSGEFVTLHDADDWSHPSKIATQVEYLLNNSETIGCTSEQARLTEDLQTIRARSNFIIFNTSSFMFRRQPVRDAVGYWDTVRYGADTEFIERIQSHFGRKTFAKIPTGPLSFQRQSETSVTSGTFTGVDVERFGSRRTYHNAYRAFHKTATNLKFTGERNHRPFLAPKMMLPDRVRGTQTFDLVIRGDTRIFNEKIAEAIQLANTYAHSGKSVGLVEIFSYDRTRNDHMCVELRDAVENLGIQVLVYGDTGTYEERFDIDDLPHQAEQRFIADIRPSSTVIST